MQKSGYTELSSVTIKPINYNYDVVPSGGREPPVGHCRYRDKGSVVTATISQIAEYGCDCPNDKTNYHNA